MIISVENENFKYKDSKRPWWWWWWLWVYVMNFFVLICFVCQLLFPVSNTCCCFMAECFFHIIYLFIYMLHEVISQEKRKLPLLSWSNILLLPVVVVDDGDGFEIQCFFFIIKSDKWMEINDHYYLSMFKVFDEFSVNVISI